MIMGSYNIYQRNEAGRQERRIAQWWVTHDFEPERFRNDIAVLKVDRPFTLTTDVWPICLPEKGEFTEKLILLQSYSFKTRPNIFKIFNINILLFFLHLMIFVRYKLV